MSYYLSKLSLIKRNLNNADIVYKNRECCIMACPEIYNFHSLLPLSYNHVVGMLLFKSRASPWSLCVFTSFYDVHTRIPFTPKSSSTGLTMMTLIS